MLIARRYAMSEFSRFSGRDRETTGSFWYSVQMTEPNTAVKQQVA